MALIDKASLLMVPSTYEAGKLYNVLPSGNRAPDSTDQNSGYDQTRADFDFDRGSNAAATRVNADGLIEKYRENLLLNSNQFDTTWTTTRASFVGGQSGYDGTNDAWGFVNTTDNNTHLSVQSFGYGPSIATFSIYAKAGAVNFLAVRFEGNTGVDYAYFDLANGTLGTIDADYIDAKIESVGNGWYRCSGTKSLPNIPDNQLVLLSAQSDNDPTYAGAGTTAIYIQDAQVEKGLVATDYLDSTSVTGKAGVLVDLPRINFDANGENGALLLEPSRQQLIQYSEYFGGYNLGSGVTINQNYSTSPEGYKNATKLNLTTSANIGIEKPIGGFFESQTHTISVWARCSSGTESFRLKCTHASVLDYFSNDLTATTEWQRFEFSKAFTSTTGTGIVAGVVNGTDASARSIEIYGLQLETNATYASSYIPNHGESGGVTRAADSCLGAGEASTFNSNNGVLFWEGSILSNTTIAGAIALIGAGSNRVQLYNSGTSLVVLIQVDGGSVFGASTSGTIDITSNHKYAVKWGLNNFAFWIDGVEYATDTSGATFSDNALTEFRFSDLSTNYLYANTKQAAVFNEALNDSELATLTTL